VNKMARPASVKPKEDKKVKKSKAIEVEEVEDIQESEPKEVKTRQKKEKKVAAKPEKVDKKKARMPEPESSDDSDNIEDIENLAGESDDGSEDELAPVKHAELNDSNEDETHSQTPSNTSRQTTQGSTMTAVSQDDSHQMHMPAPFRAGGSNGANGGNPRARIEADPNVPIKDLTTPQIIQYLINRGHEQMNPTLKQECINLFRTVSGQGQNRFGNNNNNNGRRPDFRYQGQQSGSAINGPPNPVRSGLEGEVPLAGTGPIGTTQFNNGSRPQYNGYRNNNNNNNNNGGFRRPYVARNAQPGQDRQDRPNQERPNQDRQHSMPVDAARDDPDKGSLY
jgi:hypothetical protein